MNRNFYCLLTVGAFCLLATGARAQGPGGPGGFQPPPGMQAWRTWRETHKNVGALERTVGALVEVEQDPKLKLTKPQARIVLSVMKKWQSKPTMNDAQASVVNAQLLHSLSPAQKAKVAQASQPRGGFGGRPGGFGSGPGGPRLGEFGGPPGGGRPGGFGGPPPGGRPGGFGGGRGPGGAGQFGGGPASFPAPREYNPLNPSTQPMARRRDRDKQRYDQLTAALLASAK